jgi:hypothetical protein
MTEQYIFHFFFFNFGKVRPQCGPLTISPAIYIPHGRNIYQHFPFQGPPKYTLIEIFGMQMWHLATLLWPALEVTCLCPGPSRHPGHVPDRGHDSRSGRTRRVSTCPGAGRSRPPWSRSPPSETRQKMSLESWVNCWIPES